MRLIASSIQIIPDKKGMDEWGNFPLERKKLFDLIAGSGAKGIILLSGNVHFAELSKSYAEDYPLFELTSSGMTHVNETYAKAANAYRIDGPFHRAQRRPGGDRLGKGTIAADYTQSDW